MIFTLHEQECIILQRHGQCHHAQCHYAECHYTECPECDSAWCPYAECLYAECHYAECHYARCHYAEYRVLYCYAQCHYAECRYAECHYDECRGALPPLTILSSSLFLLQNKGKGIKLGWDSLSYDNLKVIFYSK
jgi:hypothetical protein